MRKLQPHNQASTGLPDQQGPFSRISNRPAQGQLQRVWGLGLRVRVYDTCRAWLSPSVEFLKSKDGTWHEHLLVMVLSISELLEEPLVIAPRRALLGIADCWMLLGVGTPQGKVKLTPYKSNPIMEAETQHIKRLTWDCALEIGGRGGAAQCSGPAGCYSDV